MTTLRAELLGFLHPFQALRRRHAQLVDELGFGYSRTDTTGPAAAVPDGVELHHFTGRTRREATR